MHHRWLILILLVLAPSARGGGIFWSDRGASQLKRMSFDGGNLQTIALTGAVTSPGSNVRGIAIDILRRRIHWADNGADQLLRANFDGSMSTILHTIQGGSFPTDIRIDLDADLVYWCDQTRGTISRSSLDGGPITEVITNAAPSGPYFMDLDTAAGKIYWGDFSGGAIYRSNLDGSERETLLTGNNSTRGVCVDTDGGMLYWINRNDKKVHRCALSLFETGTIPLTHPAVETLYANLDTPHGLAIDIPARKLYWADTGTNAGEGQGGSAVSRGDFDGSGPMEILATGSQPWDVDLDRRCQSYVEWQQRCFRRDASAEQIAPDSNPDADPWENALEYAFNLSPLHTNAHGGPQALIVTEPGSDEIYAAIRYPRRTGTTDLNCYLQLSNDLLTWQGGPGDPSTTELEVRPLGDDMSEVTARSSTPLAPGSAQFMRLVVELDSAAAP